MGALDFPTKDAWLGTDDHDSWLSLNSYGDAGDDVVNWLHQT